MTRVCNPSRRSAWRFVAGLFAAATSMAMSAPASAAERYEIRPQARPGTAWVFVHSTESSMTQKAVANGQVLQSNETIMNQKREGALVVKDVRNGLPTAAEVTFGRECSTVTKQNGQEQNIPFPLSGMSINLRREADGRVTTDAKADEQVAGEAGQLLNVNLSVYPPQAVGVGEEWEPNLDEVRQQFQAGPNDRLSVRCKLLAVGAIRGRKTYDVQLVGSLTKTQDEGTLKVTMASITQVDILTGLPIQMEGVVKISIRGEQQVQGPNGPATVTITSDGQIRLSQGALMRDEAAVERPNAERPTAEPPQNNIPGTPPALPDPEFRRPSPVSFTPSPARRETPARQETPAEPQSTSPFAGTFRGDDLSGEFKVNGGRVTGSITLSSHTYPVVGIVRDGKINGIFEADGAKFGFVATLDDDTLRLESEGSRYVLKRAGGGAPAAANPLARTARNPLE